MKKPTVVTLCGSTRFKDQFVKSNLEETLAGNIVLSIGCDLKSDNEIFGHLGIVELRTIKAKLDVLHFRKIDLSDEILVLNVDEYIGESTEREIEYAKSIGVKARYLNETT